MTSLKNIVSGTIMEVPLDRNYGYGFVKLILTEDIRKDLPSNILVKPYNKFSQTSCNKEFDRQEFETDNLIAFPWLSWGLPSTRGKNKWNLLGYAALTEADKVIPDYLHNLSFTGDVNLEKEAASDLGIAYISEFSDKRKFSNNPEAVRHLGQWIHGTPMGIKQALTFLWMNINGENPENYYSETDFDKNIWLTVAKERVTNGRHYFLELPKVTRLKAIE